MNPAVPDAPEPNDDSPRFHIDAQSAEALLMQADKIESLGRFAAGVAHEIKNPLAILQMGMECLSDRRDQLGEDVLAVLGEMETAISRADDIVRGMLHFARSGDLVLEACSVNAIVEQAAHVLRPEFAEHRIKLETQLLEPIPSVLADAARIEQVLLNLMVNAVQAMSAGGVLQVRTYYGQISEMQRDEGLRIVERLRRGDTVVVVEVRDQGPGIPEHLLQRVFDPFFTTKSTGEGTGLGLSVALRIVELHRGYLQLHNLDNPRGLRARVVLKAHGAPEHHRAGQLPASQV